MPEIKKMLRALEAKISGKLAEGVESLGELIKEQARKLKSTTLRLTDLEIKAGSKPRKTSTSR
jgi:hypothetical protein